MALGCETCMDVCNESLCDYVTISKLFTNASILSRSFLHQGVLLESHYMYRRLSNVKKCIMAEG